MSRERKVIDSDGVERIVTKLSRGEVHLEENSRHQVSSKFSEKWFRWGFYSLLGFGGVFFIILLIWGGVMLVSSDPDRAVKPAPVDDGLGERILSAEEVARAFVAETDAEKRLVYVRDPELIKQHLSSYPEQARSHPAKDIKYMGHSELNGRAVSAYAAAFGGGEFRMLSVVQTESGPKVDWDCYARYCSASWEDLFSGQAEGAEGTESKEVRVFVRPGDYHVGQFRDRGRWTCFKLETPESDRRIYAYALAGSDLSKRMQTHVMKSRTFRQHMTLKIKSVDGSGKNALFVVDELLATGWLKN